MGNQSSTNTNSSLDTKAICESAEYKQFRSKGYQHNDIIQLIANAQKQRQNIQTTNLSNVQKTQKRMNNGPKTITNRPGNQQQRIPQQQQQQRIPQQQQQQQQQQRISQQPQQRRPPQQHSQNPPMPPPQPMSGRGETSQNLYQSSEYMERMKPVSSRASSQVPNQISDNFYNESQQRREQNTSQKYNANMMPRSNMHVEHHVDKSSMEDIFQNTFQSRQGTFMNANIPNSQQNHQQQHQLILQQKNTSQNQQYPQHQQHSQQLQIQEYHRGRISSNSVSQDDNRISSELVRMNISDARTPKEMQSQFQRQEQYARSQYLTNEQLRKKNFEEEMKKRRFAFEKEMSKMQQSEKDAYILLDIPQNYDLKMLTYKYKKAALKYHPDRVRRNKMNIANANVMFQKVTKAYLLLAEKLKKAQDNNNFHDLKSHSNTYMTSQTDKFDLTQFNKIYEKNRLMDPTDDGYGDWISNEVPSESPKLFSDKFNLNVFNAAFENLKDNDPHSNQQLAIRQDGPGTIALHGENTGYSNLGVEAVDNFGGSTSNLQYTDLKEAHTNHKLINAKKVNFNSVNNVDELEKQRENIQYEMSPDELEKYELHKRMKERKEEERQNNVSHRDRMIQEQHSRLQQQLITPS
jgi:hypothetical protein